MTSSDPGRVGFVESGSGSADEVVRLSSMMSFSGLVEATERANVRNKRTVTVTVTVSEAIVVTCEEGNLHCGGFDKRC